MGRVVDREEAVGWQETRCGGEFHIQEWVTKPAGCGNHGGQGR